MCSNHDNLFSELAPPLGSFSFNQEVVSVFDDMINRSVPFYQHLQHLIVALVNDFSKEGDHIYDLGCSLGYTIESCFKSFNNQFRYITGIDASNDMIDAANSRLSFFKDYLQLIVHDLSINYNFKSSSVVILNLTLQFLPVKKRHLLLKSLYQCLNPGGILILVEKLHHDHQDVFQFMQQHYYHFKQKNGYSSKQVFNKAKALEGVLSSLTKKDNIMMIKNAGFSHCYSFFQYLQFWGCFAIK